MKSPASAPAPTLPKVESPTGQRRKKNDLNTRNLLKDTNRVGVGAPPGGCFGFFLSNNVSCSGRSKTKSGVADSKSSSPSSRSSRSAIPSKENLGGDRLKDDKPKKYPPLSCQWQKGRRSEPASVPAMVGLESGSRELGKKQNPTGSINAGENRRRRTLSRFIDDVVVGRTDTTHDNDMHKEKLTKEDDITLPIETPISPETRCTPPPPPIEASESPEIQCGSFRLSKIKPASFFGSGRVASGVSDNRKLRPRRILTVGDQDSGISIGGVLDGFSGDDVVSNCSRVSIDLMPDKAVEETTTSTRKDDTPLPSEAFLPPEIQCGVRGRDSGFGEAKIFDPDDDGDTECVPAFPDNSKVSPVPSPAEAVMTLISSPRGEDGSDHTSDSGRLVDSRSTSSTLRGHYFSSNTSDASSGSTASSKTSNTCTTSGVSSIGPSGVPEFQGSAEPPLDRSGNCSPLSAPRPCPLDKAIVPPKERTHGYIPARESSPFFMDSLTNKNVLQTRQSVSTPDRHFFGPPWIDVDEHGRSWFESELDLLAEVFQKTSIRPSQNQISTSDLASLNFQFTQSTTPFDSIDLSQCQARISWREGLVSRIFDLDEMDSFKCFFDEEESVSSCNNDQVTAHPSPELIVDVRNHPALCNDFQSPKIVDDDPVRDMKGKEKLASQRHSSYSYIESICADADSLSSSGESDWNLCYRNQLYEL